jgi:uncharacterized protein (TIGR02246 family)
MRRMLLVTILIAAFASLAQGQSSSASARKAIEANLKSFVIAFNKGDAAGVAANYATNAKLLPPNGAIVEGRQNIQTFWQGGIDAGLKIWSLTTVDVTPAGNLAIETGKYVTTVPAAGDTTTSDEGKYVVVWQRQGRGWKIIRDIFNSDKPMP